MGRLEDIKERTENATPGPWEVKEESILDSGLTLTEKWVHAPAWMRLVVRAASNYPAVTHRGEQDFADMTFIAQARDDIPWLLDEIERLRAALEHAARMKTIKGARVIVRDALEEGP